jgi:hypothetical protein
MLDRSGNPFALPARHVVATGAAVLLALTIATGVAWCQTAPPPTSPDAQPPAQQAAPEPSASPQGDAASRANPPAHEENPGLINEIGKMFGKLRPSKSPGETIDDFNARAKDAADSLSHLTTSSMASGRVACPVSGNGAPDCKNASDKLCQTKGFKEGKSLTTDSAETCSAKVLIPGRTRKPDDCRTDTYVTRALCQ